jgi:hypothetical protein
MLPKQIQIPKPNSKTVEEAQKWAEDFIVFFERFYSSLYNESLESTRLRVRSKAEDGTIIHKFGE